MKNVLIFILGGAVGSLVTWKLVEGKYKKLADEEIASVVDRFKDKKKEDIVITNHNGVPTEDISLEERYGKKNVCDTCPTSPLADDKKKNKKIIKKKGYFTDGDTVTLDEYEVEVDEDYQEPVIDMPEVISPEEFGELPDYDIETWDFYKENFTVVDSEGNIVDDPSFYIGDALLYFGDYCDDAVYARNKDLKRDYEVLLHEEKYSK